MPSKPEPKPIRPLHAKTRLSAVDRERLDNSHHTHKTTDTEVLEGLILAYLDEVERIGFVRFPITISMAPLALREVAEDKGPYTTGQPKVDKPPKPPPRRKPKAGEDGKETA